MTEYWLQKKSLGGWSAVTWYSDLDQAKLNYQRCIEKGMSGYSWRLVEVKVVEQALLDEVTDIAASPDAVDAMMYTLKPLKKTETVKYSGWDLANPKPVSNGWGDTKSGWSGVDPADPYAKENRLNETDGFYAKSEHGLSGSVWVIHHKDKIKKRVAATAVDEMLKLGYERGGPKTKFRE